jgi:hypothetical protein
MVSQKHKNSCTCSKHVACDVHPECDYSVCSYETPFNDVCEHVVLQPPQVTLHTALVMRSCTS